MSAHAQCDTCERMTFDPKPCVTCFKTDRKSALCSDHRVACPCGEFMCPDHATVCVVDGESQLLCRECAERWENEEQSKSERAFEQTLSGDFGPSGRDYAERVHRLWLR